MIILTVFKRLITDAQNFDTYAITIILLTILLLISYFRRNIIKSNMNDLLKEKQNLKNKLFQSQSEANNLSQKLTESLNKNKAYEEQEAIFKNKISEIKKELYSIREKYSAIYQQLLLVNESKKNIETQLQSYRLSPHFLKNLINKAFIESKLSFEDDDIKTNFSFFGRKYSRKENLAKQLELYKEKLDKSLILLIDILNYLLYSSGANKVHLQTEKTHLAMFCKLIEMHNNVKVELREKFDKSDIYIQPTILFNFIDNAIKHGYFKNKPLLIKLSCDGNVLDYSVETPLHPKMNNTKMGGIGNNDFECFIKRCYDSYEISNDIIDNTYIAKLKIIL